MKELNGEKTDRGNETESQKTQNERRKEIIHGESSREREREREKSVRISNKQLCIISTVTINNTTPASNNVISRAILTKQALARDLCRSLLPSAEIKSVAICAMIMMKKQETNNPVQHQTKPKRVLYFDSICRGARRERVVTAVSQKTSNETSSGDQENRDRHRLKLEKRDGMREKEIVTVH